MEKPTSTPSHFVLYPAQTYKPPEPWIVPCTLGTHHGWGIDAARDHSIPINVITPDDDLVDILYNLARTFDETENKVCVKWLDEMGGKHGTSIGTPEEVSIELMNFILENTPDDAANHPLEELRIVLDELAHRHSAAPGP
jgi:hypothetical protein